MKWIEFVVKVKTENYGHYETLLLKYAESVVVSDPKATLAHIEKGQWEAHGFSKEALREEPVRLSIYLKTDAFLNKKLENLKNDLLGEGEKQGEYLLFECISLPDVDWSIEWQKNYEVLSFGERVEIVPVWLEPSGKRDVVIKIEPGLAFGTGSHETTALPLALLEKYIKKEMCVFDLGTGSGILALVAKSLGAEKVFGYDYDSVAVRVANEQSKLNNLEVTFLESNLFQKVEGKADFIIANIVTKILLLLLPDLDKYLAPFGKVLFSGISVDTLEEMKRAVTEYHFKIVEEVQKGEWVALVLERKHEVS